MRKSELVKIIRECIEEIEMNEGIGTSIKNKYHKVNAERNRKAGNKLLTKARSANQKYNKEQGRFVDYDSDADTRDVPHLDASIKKFRKAANHKSKVSEGAPQRQKRSKERPVDIDNRVDWLSGRASAVKHDKKYGGEKHGQKTLKNLAQIDKKYGKPNLGYKKSGVGK